MESEEIRKSAGQYWSKVTKQEKGAPRLSWGHSARVREHISNLICGTPNSSPISALFQRCNELFHRRTFDHGVSIGCGNAFRELHMVKHGFVGRFDLFEISDERIKQGKEKAEELGIANQINFHSTDFYQHSFSSPVDFVFWCHSLHHMLDVARAVEWSKDVLEYDGVFMMNDFVGANRFQWPEEYLAAATRARSSLPEPLLANPTVPDHFVPTKVTAPDRDALIARDPTEAPDSENILPAINAVFDAPEVILVGGVIYHLALSEIMANFIHNPEFDPLLDSLLWVDETLATQKKMSNFACAIARKN